MYVWVSFQANTLLLVRDFDGDSTSEKIQWVIHCLRTETSLVSNEIMTLGNIQHPTQLTSLSLKKFSQTSYPVTTLEKGCFKPRWSPKQSQFVLCLDNFMSKLVVLTETTSMNRERVRRRKTRSNSCAKESRCLQVSFPG